MPYLVRDKCNKCYKLKIGESAADIHYCSCGNTLKYYDSITEHTKILEPSTNTKKDNILNYWTEQTTVTKLIFILVIFCMGSLFIAGILSILSGTVDSETNTQTAAVQNNKLTLIVFYASWCPKCHEYDKTLSDSRVKEKIKNYNYQKVDIDQNTQTATKYAQNATMVLPTTIILDTKGNIIAKYQGILTPDQLLRVL